MLGDRLMGYVKTPRCANSRGTATKLELVTIETLSLTPSDAQRFWAKVDKSGECWTWTSERSYEGYGRFWLKGRRIAAHRIALILATARQEPELLVLHACDNTACVNPKHLRYGTHEENMADMYSRNRKARMHGEANRRAKLTEEDVRTIRADLAMGVRNRELVKRYGVSAQTISDIKSRITWSHLEETPVAA